MWAWTACAACADAIRCASQRTTHTHTHIQSVGISVFPKHTLEVLVHLLRPSLLHIGPLPFAVHKIILCHRPGVIFSHTRTLRVHNKASSEPTLRAWFLLSFVSHWSRISRTAAVGCMRCFSSSLAILASAEKNYIFFAAEINFGEQPLQFSSMHPPPPSITALVRRAYCTAAAAHTHGDNNQNKLFRLFYVLFCVRPCFHLADALGFFRNDFHLHVIEPIALSVTSAHDAHCTWSKNRNWNIGFDSRSVCCVHCRRKTVRKKDKFAHSTMVSHLNWLTWSAFSQNGKRCACDGISITRKALRLIRITSIERKEHSLRKCTRKSFPSIRWHHK